MTFNRLGIKPEASALDRLDDAASEATDTLHHALGAAHRLRRKQRPANSGPLADEPNTRRS